MGSEGVSTSKKTSRVALTRLIQERERLGWTQSELAHHIGTTQVNVSRWEQGNAFPSAYYRQKLAALFGKTLEELELLRVNENDNNELASSSQIHQIPEIWNIPYHRNPFFTGREEILDHLHSVLTDSYSAALTQAQAISGLGGIGKTQIAVEYAYRHTNQYNAILWVTALSRDVLIADFIMLANILDLPEKNEQDQDIVLRAVKRWMATHASWLLIVDNIDDLKMILDVLPTRFAGKVLLTTRLQALGALAQPIEVDKMGREEGQLFLLRRAKILNPGMSLHQLSQEEQTLADKIVTELDGLPLALDQAGAYIEETQCGSFDYLNLYRTRRKELLEKRSTGMHPIDHPDSVTATWLISFQQIEEINQAAADLLRLFAFFEAEGIPEEILTAGANELGPTLGPEAADPLKLNDAVSILLRYSLIRRNSEERLLSLHRLVQSVIKDGMEQDLQRTWAERAIRSLNQAFPDVEQNTWSQCQRCLSHVLISTAYLDDYDLAFPEAARLLNQAANYLSTHAQYVQAESLLRKASAIREQYFTCDQPDIAITFNDLGMLYLVQAKYKQAQPLLQQALIIREKVLGAEHPDTITNLDNLAQLYHAQGGYDQAEKLNLQVLKVRQQIFKPDHPDIARSLSHLAELYTDQGKYTQAEELYLQAIEILNQVLGVDHLDLAEVLDNLALVYRKKGEYEEAEKLYLKALETQERNLGDFHPIVAQTLNNLARLYRAQGEYNKAEPFYLRALRIREQVFDPDHPQVAQSYYGLAKLYHTQGKYLEAEELCKRALRIQEHELGTDHPSIAYTLINFAKIYRTRKQYAEAEALYERALAIRKSTLGMEHPNIALILSNLAEVYLEQGKYLEAQPLIIQSLEIRKRTLSPEHPYIAYSLSNLAESYFLQRDYTKAEALYKEALTIREQTLGSAHPHTASTYFSLAKLYHALEQFEQAEKYYERALAIREQTLGLNHPDIAINLECYANLLRRIGREHLAIELEARAIAININDSGDVV